MSYSSFLSINGINLRIFGRRTGNSLVVAVFSRGDFIFIVFLPEYMISVEWYPSDGLNQPTTEASIPWVAVEQHLSLVLLRNRQLCS